MHIRAVRVFDVISLSLTAHCLRISISENYQRYWQLFLTSKHHCGLFLASDCCDYVLPSLFVNQLPLPIVHDNWLMFTTFTLHKHNLSDINYPKKYPTSLFTLITLSYTLSTVKTINYKLLSTPLNTAEYYESLKQQKIPADSHTRVPGSKLPLREDGDEGKSLKRR